MTDGMPHVPSGAVTDSGPHDEKSEAMYDYGPPVDNSGDPPGGSPHEDTDSVTTPNQGAAPHEPPENTDTVVEPGGSPAEETGLEGEPPEDVSHVDVQPDPEGAVVDTPAPSVENPPVFGGQPDG